MTSRPTNRRYRSGRRVRRSGFLLLIALISLVIIILAATSATRLILTEMRSTRNDERRMQSGWLARAGYERARAMLRSDPAWTSDGWTATDKSLRYGAARIDARVIRNDDGIPTTIEVTADYPASGHRRARTVQSFSLPDSSPTDE